MPPHISFACAAPMFDEACAHGCRFDTVGADGYVGPACDYFCNFILNSFNSPQPKPINNETAVAEETLSDTELAEHCGLKLQFVEVICHLLPRSAVKLLYGRSPSKGCLRSKTSKRTRHRARIHHDVPEPTETLRKACART